MNPSCTAVPDMKLFLNSCLSFHLSTHLDSVSALLLSPQVCYKFLVITLHLSLVYVFTFFFNLSL
jgi:hypothetical protein